MPGQLALRQPAAGALVSDVSNFFGSIDYHLLGQQLHGARCDPDAVSVLMNILLEWARANDVSGLPIGPEASSLIGNAFLLPLDDAFEASGLTHYRFMDDVVIVGVDLCADNIKATMDSALGALRLRRNEAKTMSFPAGRAAEALQDMLMTYVGPRGDTTTRHMDPQQLRAVLDEEAEGAYPNPKHVRFALRGLGDGEAVGSLVRHQHLLNSDPLETCAYVGAHGLRDQGARDALMEATTAQGHRHAALRLHSLRTCMGVSWGASEGRVFASIATTDEHSAVRAHGWLASTRSPAWKPKTAMEAADEERHPAVRRAIVLTLRRAPSTHSKSLFLKKMRADPYVKYAARWAGVA